MAIGRFREWLGGGIVLASLLGFYGIYGLPLAVKVPQGLAFVVFSVPGLLFLLYWLLAHR